eukprot:NODE_7473_length_438_cov_147.832898.p3 GENE.NODE_7473_length_438_cov_147.832898~~NODE_7473_length_438_cov_147.832898.p3  ORF type:complete len:88 (-),score=14.60 NODE_7473_length_438_cov_147.832898:157-420(-)
MGGAPRRPGGLGDLLSGTLTTVLAWTAMRGGLRGGRSPVFACEASCELVRHACRAAYVRQKRSLVAPDVIGELGTCFEKMCPAGSPL